MALQDMRTHTRFLPVVAVLLLSACEPRGSDESDVAPASSLPAATDTMNTLLLIRPDGIGHASAGFTVADLRRALPPGATIGELDLHLFAEGKHEQIYNKLGAHVTKIGTVKGVAFAVWAPVASGVSVVGVLPA